MGVVRREGEWRLEKVGEGHYELTCQRELRGKIITPGYDPGPTGGIGFGLQTVYEVESYAEAEGVFEEHANRGRSSGIAAFGSRGSTSNDGSQDTNTGFSLGSGQAGQRGDDPIGDFIEEAEALPPGGIALILFLAGIVTIWMYGFEPGNIVFQIAAVMAICGLLIFAWGVLLFRTKGWSTAIEFLASVDGEDRSSEQETETTGSSNNTSPVPQETKRALRFERAEQSCEWCGQNLDNPEIHHIEPRSEGGSNQRSNLIVLCPTCHRKADRGGISKTMLKDKMQHIRS